MHAVGGFSGLMGAIAMGPRKGRFDPVTGATLSMPGHNASFMALGTLILWFGWYGFNCGSTLALAGAGNLAGKVAVNTTLSASTACIVGSFTTKFFEGHWDLGLSLNSILAGLVGITASCSVVDPWMAFIIGMTSAWFYYLAHCLLLKLKIDDPLDASPIHGFCGVWGLLCVGIFCTDKNVQYAAYPNTNDACGRGEQFGVQIVGAICIVVWTMVTSGIVFFGIKYTMGLRVSELIEDVGMDVSEHGGDAYNDRDAIEQAAAAKARAIEGTGPVTAHVSQPMSSTQVSSSGYGPPQMVGPNGSMVGPYPPIQPPYIYPTYPPRL